MQWIKVSDEKPPIGKPVLLKMTYPEDLLLNCRADPLSKSKIRWGGMRYNGMFISYDDQNSLEGLKYITHWMRIQE